MCVWGRASPSAGVRLEERQWPAPKRRRRGGGRQKRQRRAAAAAAARVRALGDAPGPKPLLSWPMRTLVSLPSDLCFFSRKVSTAPFSKLFLLVSSDWRGPCSTCVWGCHCWRAGLGFRVFEGWRQRQGGRAESKAKWEWRAPPASTTCSTSCGGVQRVCKRFSTQAEGGSARTATSLPASSPMSSM